MTLKKGDLYSNNTSSKKLNTSLNLQFERGWSPVLKPVYDGTRVVLQIIEWVGGEGNPPFDATINDYYLGNNDIVTDISDAVDIAQGCISSAYLSRLIDADSVTMILEDDGYLYLQYHDFENGLLGTPSTIHTISEKLLSNNTDLSPQSEVFGATQYAIKTAIDQARSKYNVPIVTLTNALVTTVEGTAGLTPDNPYFAMVGTDSTVPFLFGADATGHFVGYDGTTWYDFGVSLTNTVITTYENNGIKYWIEAGDNINVPQYHQYIVNQNLIVDGVITTAPLSQIVIL